MKHLTILSVLITLLFGACQQQSNPSQYKVSFQLDNANGDSIYLKQREDGVMQTLGSAVFVDGKAQITGEIAMPEFTYVTFAQHRGYIPLFVEPGEITITGDANDLQQVTITGSKEQDNLKAFNTATNEFDQQMNELGGLYSQARQNGDTAAMQKIEDDYMDLDAQKTAFVTDYAFEHPDQVVAAFMVLSNSYQYELPILDSITTVLLNSQPESKYAKQLSDFVSTLKKVAVGQPYIDFTLDAPDGTPLALSSVIGNNYVLVDFWASWCSPCRAENPNVVAAYNKYHDRGFDVFGVSFDKDKDAWLKAIADDGLNWSQVSDLQYWNCAAGKLYGIQSIPQNILISPDGIIIDKNLRGEDLHNKLDELLNK